MVWNLFRKSTLPEAGAIEENKVKSRKNSEDSGVEEKEEFEILESENREEAKINGSLNIKDQDFTTALEFQLTEPLLNQVRTGKDNASANSGETMYKDLCRMGNVLVINNQGIHKLGVDKLYKRYSVLIPESTDENRSYRQFSRKVFEEMFKCAGESIPASPIMEELITNCNQAGYEGGTIIQLAPIFLRYDFLLKSTSKRKIDIKYNNSNSLDINYCVNIHIAEPDLLEKEYEFHVVLEFTLETQENDVVYKDGKITFTIPEALEKHHNGKSLLNGINEHFTDTDNSVIESLIGNIGEEHRSLVIDLTAEVDSDIDDSFDVIPENLTFDETVNAMSKAVIDSNCEELEKIDSELQTLTSKDRQNILRDSLVTILENDIGKKSAHAIKYLCKNCSASIVSALEKKENKKVNNNAVLSILSNVVELIKETVDVKDVNILTTYVDVVQASIDHVSPKEGLLVVKKIEEIVIEFTKKQGEAWCTYPDILGIRNIYAAGKYLEGYISQEDYEKIRSLIGTLYKVKSSLIADVCGSNSNKGSPIIGPKGATAVANKTTTSGQVVNEENNNQPRDQKDSEPKSDSNLHVEKNVLAKNEENIKINYGMPSPHASNNYVRGKMTVVGENDVPEKLANYIRSHKFRQVQRFVKLKKISVTREMYRISVEAAVAVSKSTEKKGKAKAMRSADKIKNFFLVQLNEQRVDNVQTTPPRGSVVLTKNSDKSKMENYGSLLLGSNQSVLNAEMHGSRNTNAGPDHETKKSSSSKLGYRRNPELQSSVSQDIANEDDDVTKNADAQNVGTITNDQSKEVPLVVNVESYQLGADSGKASKDHQHMVNKNSNELFYGKCSQITSNTVSESKAVGLSTAAENTNNSDGEDKQTPVQQAIPIVPEELAAQTPPVTLIEDDVAIVSQASTSNDQTTPQQESVVLSIGNNTSRALCVATSDAQQVVPRGGTVGTIEALKNLPNNRTIKIFLLNNVQSVAQIFKKSDREAELSLPNGNTYELDLHLINEESLKVLFKKENSVLANAINDFSTVKVPILEQKSGRNEQAPIQLAGHVIRESPIQVVQPKSLVNIRDNNVQLVNKSDQPIQGDNGIALMDQSEDDEHFYDAVESQLVNESDQPIQGDNGIALMDQSEDDEHFYDAVESQNTNSEEAQVNNTQCSSEHSSGPEQTLEILNEHHSNITANINDEGVGTTINDQSTSIISSDGEDKQTPVQQAIPIVPEELAAQTPPVTLIEDDVATVSQASTSNDNHNDSSKIQLNESRTDSDQVSNQYNIAVTNENVKIPILEQKSDIKTNGKQSTNPNNGGVTEPSVQLAAPKSVDKNSGKKDTQPKLIPTGVPLVAIKDSNRVNNVQGNSKQPSYLDKNNPAPQNAKSKLPVIAAAMLAITGVAAGIATAVYLEMLAVGIAFGACCLAAATIVYYCNKPSKSLESSNAERVTSAEIAVEK